MKNDYAETKSHREVYKTINKCSMKYQFFNRTKRYINMAKQL